MLALVATLLFALTGSTGVPQILMLPDKPDPDGSPTQTAAVCIDGDRKSCWRPGAHIFREPKLEEMNLGPGQRAYAYKAEGIGGSGWPVVLALLRVENGKLRDLLPDVALTNIGEYQFWNVQEVSASPLLVVADFIWASNEAHYESHRYQICAYLQGATGNYRRVLRYETSVKYDPEKRKVLEGEKGTVLAKLRAKHHR